MLFRSAAAGHEGGGGACEADQGIGADVMGRLEGLAAGVQEITLKRLAGCEGDAVEEEVQPAEALAHSGEDGVNLAVLRDVAGQDQRVRSEGASELLDVFLEPIALVGEGQFRARAVPRLRDSEQSASWFLTQNSRM